jgi:hypothetical protein
MVLPDLDELRDALRQLIAGRLPAWPGPGAEKRCKLHGWGWMEARGARYPTGRFLPLVLRCTRSARIAHHSSMQARARDYRPPMSVRACHYPTVTSCNTEYIQSFPLRPGMHTLRRIQSQHLDRPHGLHQFAQVGRRAWAKSQVCAAPL